MIMIRAIFPTCPAYVCPTLFLKRGNTCSEKECIIIANTTIDFAFGFDDLQFPFSFFFVSSPLRSAARLSSLDRSSSTFRFHRAHEKERKRISIIMSFENLRKIVIKLVKIR